MSRWQIVLKSPEYLLPSVLLLLLLVIVRNILMFGMSVDVSLVSGFLLFAFYMRMRCFIYKGALVLLPLNSPRLKWCLDMRGRLYPHLAPGLTKNVPDRVATHTIRKQWLQSACDAIERAGMFGRPIVVKTPFGLDGFYSRLEVCGWKIERQPSTATPWPLRITLMLRRSRWKNRSPWRRSWRDVGVMHHAILYPPPIAFDK